MLTEDDFELVELPESMTIISLDCPVARDVQAQRDLAQMCIAKAKLCLCVSHILSTQYFVLARPQYMQDQDQNASTSGMMLFLKSTVMANQVKHCDDELRTWTESLSAVLHLF